VSPVYEVPGAPEGDDDERWAEIKKTIQLRVCNVIKKWVEEYYDDFTPAMRKSLQSWIAYMAISQKNHADTLTASLRKVRSCIKEYCFNFPLLKQHIYICIA
jgi:hypothetical protein